MENESKIKLFFIAIGNFFVRLFSPIGHIWRKFIAFVTMNKEEYAKCNLPKKIIYQILTILPRAGIANHKFASNRELSILRDSFGKKVLRFLSRILDAFFMFFVNIIVKFGKLIANICVKFWELCKDIVMIFVNGTWKTRVSYLIFGFGNIFRKQYFKGFLFLIFEAVFIFYMINWGGYWLKMFGSLGLVGPDESYDEILDTYVPVYGDDSFKILLYGILTIIFIVACFCTFVLNIKQCKTLDYIERANKKQRTNAQDLRALVDEEFHKTLLSIPLLGILAFTVLPTLFMIFVAFTNYDGEHNGYTNNLFSWVGLDNFNEIMSFGTTKLSYTFGEILSWTLIWAFFATFTNYFLGMIVAMIINKKGIKLKKLWRGVLVLSIAIPQFISLLYVSKIFAKNGLINSMLGPSGWGWYDTNFDFWGTPWVARMMVILVNIWIGIPYLMLVSTGILMNIPQDLYESAKIDGANTFQQYTKITLPYMLFVTGPYLLTQFIGNLNNFNVIFLLTGGGPTNPDLTTPGSTAGDTDLLITWLFNLTTGTSSNYKLASVIGIMIFVVVSVLSLIVYNIMPSTKNEEDFS